MALFSATVHGVVVLSVMLFASGVEEDPRFVDALQRFEDMDTAGALEALRGLLDDDALADADRATVELWVGVNLCELGEYENAGVSFERAIRLDPLVALPADASPRVLQEINQARARVRDSASVDEPEPDPPPEAAPPSPDRATAEPEPAFPWLLVSGAGVAAAGVAAAGLGASFGLLALSQREGAVVASSAADALGELEDARTSALVANAMYIAGGALLVGGGATAIASLFVGGEP
jgi:hypothetical protein